MNLEKIREKISAIDQKIVGLLNERAKFVLKIADEKLINKYSIYQPDRERQVLEHIEKINKGPIKHIDLKKIYVEIMGVMISMESNLKFAYLGPEGSYAHSAADKKFGSAIPLKPYLNIKSIFKAIQEGDCKYGIVPFENKTEGMIDDTLDALLEYDLEIYSEVKFSVDYHLISKAKKIKDISYLYSEQKIYLESDKWLLKNFSHIPWIKVSSISEAINQAVKDKKAAVIVSTVLTKIYKIPILANNIHNNDSNLIRFIIIGKDLPNSSGKNHTLISFLLLNDEKKIFKITNIFKKNKVNVLSIKSRSKEYGIFSYLFFIEIEGHQLDRNIMSSLEMIKDLVKNLKILGSFPLDYT